VDGRRGQIVSGVADKKTPSEGLVSNGASSRRPIEIQRSCVSVAERYSHRLPLIVCPEPDSEIDCKGMR
jgi:hypothetical protein